MQIDLRYDQVVLRALENDPERRYQHASELRTDVTAEAPTAGPGGALRRARDGRWIGGVCAGIAASWSCSPVWLRLGFLILPLVGFAINLGGVTSSPVLNDGIWFLLSLPYPLLWILMPGDHPRRTTGRQVPVLGTAPGVARIVLALFLALLVLALPPSGHYLLGYLFASELGAGERTEQAWGFALMVCGGGLGVASLWLMASRRWQALGLLWAAWILVLIACLVVAVEGYDQRRMVERAQEQQVVRDFRIEQAMSRSPQLWEALSQIVLSERPDATRLSSLLDPGWVADLDLTAGWPDAEAGTVLDLRGSAEYRPLFVAGRVASVSLDGNLGSGHVTVVAGGRRALVPIVLCTISKAVTIDGQVGDVATIEWRLGRDPVRLVESR